jgi:3-hydroxybenzoate 6-monooxygenase
MAKQIALGFMSDLPFLVAGGGIGGLAAALGLAGHGRAVRLFEQAPPSRRWGPASRCRPTALQP